MTRIGLLLVAMTCATALAADTDDIAFLEFLGSFSDEDGGWLDPLALEDAVSLSDVTVQTATDEDTTTEREAHDDT